MLLLLVMILLLYVIVLYHFRALFMHFRPYNIDCYHCYYVLYVLHNATCETIITFIEPSSVDMFENRIDKLLVKAGHIWQDTLERTLDKLIASLSAAI